MIKPVTRNEIPQCVELIKTSFIPVAEQYGITRENAPRYVAYSTTDERLYGQYDEEHRPMFGYYENGKIVGYYSLSMQEDNECELNNLAVLPAYRHNKIGEQLLLHAFDTAKQLGRTKVNIGIVEENQILRKWYEKYGAVHTGTQKFDFFPFTCGYLVKFV